jgi:hypothetical protein
MAKDQTLGASKNPSAVVSVEPSASAKLTGVPARRSARPDNKVLASFKVRSAAQCSSVLCAWCCWLAVTA